MTPITRAPKESTADYRARIEAEDKEWKARRPKGIYQITKTEVRKLKTTDIKTDDIPAIAQTHRGSVGRDIINAFLDSNKPALKLEPEGDDKMRSIGWSIARAIKTLKVEKKVEKYMRDNVIYLKRIVPADGKVEAAEQEE